MEFKFSQESIKSTDILVKECKTLEEFEKVMELIGMVHEVSPEDVAPLTTEDTTPSHKKITQEFTPTEIITFIKAMRQELLRDPNMKPNLNYLPIRYGIRDTGERLILQVLEEAGTQKQN